MKSNMALSLVKHCKLPIWLSLIMKNNNVLLDGTDIEYRFQSIAPLIIWIVYLK